MDESEKAHRRAELEMKVSKIVNEFVDTYLRDNPRISPATIADFFGAYDEVLVKNARRNATSIHIPDLKRVLKQRAMKQYDQSGAMTDLRGIEFLDKVFVPPGKGEIKSGDGSGVEQKEVIPRTQYLEEV